MKDGNHSVAELSEIHEAYWADKEITKGCGWKPFKRWESLMLGRQHTDGMPMNGEDYTRVYNEVKSFNSIAFTCRKLASTWSNTG